MPLGAILGHQLFLLLLFAWLARFVVLCVLFQDDAPSQ